LDGFHVVVVWKVTFCVRRIRRIASRPTVVIFSRARWAVSLTRLQLENGRPRGLDP
jgi:hypothetical protein